MAIDNTRVWKTIRSYLIISFGLFLYVIAWVAFLIPNKIVGGGALGMATVTHYLSGNIIPTNVAFFAINAILVAIGTKVLGKGFGAKTIYGILFVFLLLSVLPEPTFITQSFQESDKLLYAIIGGLVSGLGIAITFMQGGSAGGTDIVALIVNKYKEVSPGRVFLFADMIIIGASFFIEWDFRTIIYGYVVMGVFSYSVDLFLSGNKQSLQVFIFSKKYAEIGDAINQQVRRGVTALYAQGWYSKAENKVLIVIVRKNEVNLIYQIVKQIDEQAFLSVSNVMGVYGHGFDTIKKKTETNKLLSKLKNDQQASKNSHKSNGTAP